MAADLNTFRAALRPTYVYRRQRKRPLRGLDGSVGRGRQNFPPGRISRGRRHPR